MKYSYTSNYIKIYAWQFAAFVLRFLSLFIVTPYLSKDPSIYGIYTVCISINIYLNYADLGFLRAGQKFAAECYARDERKEEMRYIGFGLFVLLVFSLLIASIFFFLGLHPEFLLKGLDSPSKIAIATKLLIVLAIFTPFTVLQRMISMIFEIRLESYIFQRISLFASIIIIGSVLFFFHGNSYRIIQYFFFSQIINTLVLFFCIWLARKRYTYNFAQLLRCIHFDLQIFGKVKKLAFSGLFVMIAWIIFYELDAIIIGKFFGAEKVAIFSISFTFATLFRTIYAILFSPFAVRVNHFIGKKDEEGLRKFCSQLLNFSAPFVIIPTVTFAVIAKPFILSWVGTKYLESVSLATLFSLIFTLSFISYITSILLVAKERVREMYIITTLQPIIYWLGIMLTYSQWGLISFPAFKLLATVISEGYYLVILIGILGISYKEFFVKTIGPIIFPLFFIAICLSIANHFFSFDKSKIHLFIVLSTTAFCIFLSMVILYITNTDFKCSIKNTLKNFSPKVST